jgi:hypothetical protein
LKKELVKLASLQRGSEDKIVGTWIKAVLWLRNKLPRFIRNLLGLILSLFGLVTARRWEDGAIMNQPDCIAVSRHVLVYPYFAFGAAKIPHGLLQGGTYCTSFLVERISY